MGHSAKPCGYAAAAVFGPMAVLSQADAMPDTFLARVEALASMETLNADILTSRSATKALEHWCGVHAMAADPKIHAELLRGEDKPLDETQRRRLAITSDETVKYRHVRLTCGDRVLSDADNWYVPSRLTPEMNRLLDATDTPFGKAVAALNFTRETFAAETVWMPLPEDWQIHPPAPDHPNDALDIPKILFEHRAVLYDAQHKPFSLVSERYTREVLNFGRSP